MTDEENREVPPSEQPPAEGAVPEAPSPDSAAPDGEAADGAALDRTAPSESAPPARPGEASLSETTGLEDLQEVSAQQARATGRSPGGDRPQRQSTPTASPRTANAARRVLAGLGLLCLAGVAAVGGYAANLALEGQGAAGEESVADGANGEANGDAAEDPPEAPAAGPFGNPAGLSYTRLGGTDFLVVRDGAAVATLSPQSAQAGEGGVVMEFTAEYHPAYGEYTVRAEDFFHYAHPGGVVPEAGSEDLGIRPEAEELAVLTPEAPEQEFTVELPGAPYLGVVSYDAAEELDLGLSYRTPLCYQVDADFSPHREDCEAVPGPGF
jgi:hypothetical protein